MLYYNAWRKVVEAGVIVSLGRAIPDIAAILGRRLRVPPGPAEK
jgi:hypothetical protein